ncbi:MAG: Ig-like domain-containing protein [Paracoccaceae bacterium]
MGDGRFKILVIVLFWLCFSLSASACNRYWVAASDGTDKFWHDRANWSNASGGSGGAVVPGRYEIACFDNGSVVDAKLNGYVKVKQLRVTGTYNGTIDLNGYELGSVRNLVIYNGTILLSGNSYLRTWRDFYLYGGGTVTASGSGSRIKVRNNLHIWGTLTAPSSGSFSLLGGFNLYSSGTFNHNNGTVSMSPRWRGTTGAAIKIDAGPGTGRNFYNLTKSGNKNVTITTNDIKIENNLTAWGVGKIRAQSNDIEIGGNLSFGNANNLVPGTGTVEFNGTSAQTIDSKANFYKLTISNSNVSLLRSANISNILRIRPGATFDINGNNLTASTLVNNGNLQLSGNETLSITTKDTDSGTITYDGTATGLIYGNTYYNLALNTSGTITLNSNLDVNGSLTITDGTLNAGNNDINVAGNWTNNDSFVSGTGKVTFDGASVIVTGGTESSNDFYDVTLAGTSAAQSTNAIAIDNDFEITSSGTWYTNCLAMNISGTSTVGSGSIATTLSPTLTFNPTDSSTGFTSSSNLILTFNTAMQNTDNSTLTDSNVDSLITLKDTNSSGSDIDFDATINSEKKIITINPDSNFSSLQTVYVAIGTTVENSCETTISAASATFTVADTAGPTETWSPANSATEIAVDSNITLTFNEAVRNIDDTVLTDTNVDSLITLKTTNSSGSDIDFNATIDSDKKIITINPDGDFSSEQVIYVAIGTTVEDDANNAISASSATFTARNTGTNDTSSPTITFSPLNSATGVAKDANITLTFNEALRNNDDTEITDANVDSLITLKRTNSSGSDIAFDATIDPAKRVITINPSSDFSSEQVIYVAIEASVEDSYDNAISASSATFTSADSVSPILSFDPQDLENPVPVTDNITITFSEPIRNTDDSALTSTNVDSLITLKDTDENGSDIDFNATIDSDKKIITIDPNSSFSSEQTVYLAIGTTVEDSSDNVITASSITFIAADSTAPNLDFTPADSKTGVAVNSDITIAFDEAIRNTDDTALTDSNVDSLITLKTTNSSGTDIGFDAVIDNSKQLITIAPNTDFSSEQVIYVAIGATVEDDSDNAISASSITFTAADSTAPTVAFVPPDSTNCVPISSNVSLTFSEAVRNSDDTTITDTNVGNLITLEYTSDSSPVAFTATIDSDKKIITINPDSDFISGEVVNVAIETVEDLSDNAMSATSGTFCVVDSTPPILTFSPANSSTMVSEDTNIILTFDEEIRLVNDSALNNVNVDDLITLKENDGSGSDIAFDATIDSDSKIITIDLVSNLSSSQIIYVAIGATVEDTYNNAITAASATFTTGDSLPPTVSIDAVITASIATDSDITFTFSEAVRNLDNSELTSSNVGSLITLKETDENGSDLAFSATINSAKTIITINPTSNFSSKQVIYAAIGATVEDYADNVIPASSKTFVAEYLATSLTNPLLEKDVIGLIEGQLEAAERGIRHTTTPILRRMEWLRRNKGERNLYSHGIKINFENQKFKDISNAIKSVRNKKKPAKFLPYDWAMWSEGSITFGKIETTNISSMKKFRSHGVTFGFDKVVTPKLLYGTAIRIGNDDDNIGSSGSTLDTNNYTTSLYGTYQFGQKSYIDGVVGIGALRITQNRNHASGILLGKRKGRQLSGTILYGAEFNNKHLRTSPYVKIDAAVTKLSSFSESGTVAAINYEEQKSDLAKASLGLKLDKTIELGELTIKPNSRLEYSKGIIDHSNAVLAYNVYPNTEYSLNFDKKETENFRIGFGTDIDFQTNWLLSSTFERIQYSDTNYETSFNIGTSYKPDAHTKYDLSLSSNNSSNKKLGVDYDKMLDENWWLNLGLEVGQRPLPGYDETVYFRTEISF